MLILVFLDKYLREKEVLGSIRRCTRDELNKGVLQAYEFIQDVYDSDCEERLNDINRDVETHNQLVYGANNICEGDILPSYFAKDLQDTVTDLSDVNKYDLEERRQFHLSELYDAVRKDGLDSYLSDDVMDVLNSDSFSFRSYDDYKLLGEMHEQDKKKSVKDDLQSKPRDYSLGFELDENGNVMVDDFGFEECD